MNSPPRVVAVYKQSYDNKPFVPLHREIMDGFHCIRVEPSDPSFFYRMDTFKGSESKYKTADAVFGTDRNTYFGLRPSDIMDAYKTHTNLYVVKPNTPIVLLDMGVLENVERILASAPPEFAHSIRTGFPIDEGVVKRHSVPAVNHNNGINHDRRALEYICTLPGIDGYYVDVEGLHPEIGLCAGSLAKLTVVDMFRIRAAQEQPVRGKRPLPPNSLNSNRTRRRLMPPEFPPNSSGKQGPFGLLSFEGLEGGKRKRRAHRKRRTQRKHRAHRK